MSDGLLRWGYLPRPRRTKAAPRKRRTAHRPVPSLGKSGTHCENRAFRGSQTAPPTFCNPGQRDPWQAGFVRTNPMLAETKTGRCIRSRPPRRSHANPQSSAHLQLPSSCLAGVAGPATWRAYGLPGRGKQTTRPRGDKSGPAGSARQTRDRPPAPGGPGTHWGEYSNQRATDGPAAAPGIAVYLIPDGLGDPAKPAIVCGFGSANDSSLVAFMSHICCTAI